MDFSSGFQTRKVPELPYEVHVMALQAQNCSYQTAKGILAQLITKDEYIKIWDRVSRYGEFHTEVINGMSVATRQPSMRRQHISCTISVYGHQMFTFNAPTRRQAWTRALIIVMAAKEAGI